MTTKNVFINIDSFYDHKLGSFNFEFFIFEILISFFLFISHFTDI